MCAANLLIIINKNHSLFQSTYRPLQFINHTVTYLQISIQCHIYTFMYYHPLLSCTIIHYFHVLSSITFMYYHPLLSCTIIHYFHVLSSITFMYYHPLLSCTIIHYFHVLSSITFMYYHPLLSCTIIHYFHVLSSVALTFTFSYNTS